MALDECAASRLSRPLARSGEPSMSALKPIAITSLAEEAFGKLVQAITSGEFEPGQKFSESELARRLGISRARCARRSVASKDAW